MQTVAPPPEGLFGSLDRALPGTTRSLIDALNTRLAARILQSQDTLLDVAALAETVGLAEWHSPAQWNMAKLPFADAYVPLYADHVARTIAAMRGRSRRCLVLDLDNTVWGGVIGDDGLDGIRIAQGDAIGEAHLAVQQLALALRARGVVLAVSSKNTDSVAREPFRSHPEMLLREDHIAVFQANWDDKASNIQGNCAGTCAGLGLAGFSGRQSGRAKPHSPRDARRSRCRSSMSDPAGYARTLAAAGYFEADAVFPTRTGCAREDVPEQMHAASALQGIRPADLGSISADRWKCELCLARFDQNDPRAHYAQLINKSNQFNLTTRRRRTEADLAGPASEDPAYAMLLHVAAPIDRFRRSRPNHQRRHVPVRTQASFLPSTPG